MRIITYFVFFTVFIRKVIHGDMFSSIEHLRYLHGMEASLINNYKEFLSNIKSHYTKLEKYLKNLKSMEKENKKFSNDNDDYITNPLNAVLLFKRLSYDSEQVVSTFKNIVNDFKQRIKNHVLPITDFEGAVNGFLRLQKTYDLKTNDIANGIIGEEKIHKGLTVEDLYELGKMMVKSEPLIGQDYLSLALHKNRNSRKLPEFEILDELLNSYRKVNDFRNAISTVEQMLKIRPEDEKLETLKSDLELSLLFEEEEKIESIKDEEEDISGSHFTTKKDFILLSDTCKGLRSQNISVISKLYCFMDSKTSFTKIAPFKVEVMNLEPYIAVFYDVISDEEINVLKNISSIRLTRAEVLKPNLSNVVSEQRVAKLSWFYDGSHKVIDILNTRVGDMSGLSLKTAEMIQIQNYGIGGHYIPHFDFFFEEQNNRNVGNRIATSLFYLSDVKMGGATVFPFLRLRVLPIKGAAVFWYNLSTSGSKEYLTLHGACPVLIGSKWVANKWFREYGQEFNRPCELIEKPTDADYRNKYYVI